MPDLPTPPRRATPADAPAIRALTRAAYAKWVPLIGREPTPMTVDYDARARNHLIDLWDAAADLVALIETVPEIDHLLIENVAVAPASQGQGYGRRLMSYAETLARSLNLMELRLYTNTLFTGNVRLYSSLGYRVDREEPFKGSITVYMSKQLTTA
jgi:GNAT superfamily N-acetyltransferase